MDTDYINLINNHKSFIVLSLLLVVIITIATVFGITLFKKYRQQFIPVTKNIISNTVISITNDDMESTEYHLLQEKNAENLQIIIQLALHNDDAFFLKFNEFDANFRKNLLKIAPDLVSSELVFCALLKLNFDTKEIARFTSISVRAVEGKKYRIRKKLNIGSKEDINIFMVNI